ncbi:LruC domain-containing protein [Bacteroides sp.]
MTLKKLTKTYLMAFSTLFATSIMFTGCTERNLYDPDYGKEELPSPETLPDFSTRSNIALDVDYEAPGCKTLVEIYTEYPYEITESGDVVKKNILPLFAGYSDNNGKISEKINLPTAINKVYLCTPTLGLPHCLGLDVTSAGIQFKRSDLSASESNTRAEASTIIGYPAVYKDNLYRLYEWGQHGESNLPGFITPNEEVTADWIRSIQSTLWNGKDAKPNSLNNGDKVVDEQYTNISIAKTMMVEGKSVSVENARITLTFISESGWFRNTFGYYYYPTGQKPDLKDLKKYILFPNASIQGNPPYDNGAASNTYTPYSPNRAPIQVGSKVTLLYEDENGVVSDKFPSGYTIGWFLISNGFTSGNQSNNPGTVNADGGYLYSNRSWNVGQTQDRCIALNDKATGRVIVGFEDSDFDKSYEDVLFFVESDPRGAIIDPDKPNIDEGGDIEIPDGKMKTIGTLAFEDLWPDAGDYDMNDVVVEYTNLITFDSENYVKSVVSTFKPVQRVGSASYYNAFALHFTDQTQIGSITTSPENMTYEQETQSVVLFPDARNVKDEEFTVTRDLTNLKIKVADLKEYDPYIIVKYAAGMKNRVEVHLPKRQPTAWANMSLVGTQSDLYYIDRGGKFPFAIDLPIHDYRQPLEGKRIDDVVNEYPDYIKWVDNGCSEKYSGWYLK